MTQQPGQGTDITADDLEVSPDAPPATSDPDAFVDDGLGTGDGPDVQAPADSGS